MKKDIPFYINRFLLLQPELHVQGLGIFIKTYTSAQINADETNLNPPYFDISFKADQSVHHETFSTFLAYLTGENPSKWQSIISSFSADVQSKVHQSGECLLPHFGRFYRKNEEIQFEADVTAGKLNLWQLKPVESIMQKLESSESEAVKTPSIEPVIVLPPDPDEIGQIASETEEVKNDKTDIVEIQKIEVPEPPKPFKPQVATSMAMEVPRIHATMYPSASTFRKSRDNEWQGRILAWLFGISLILLIASMIIFWPRFMEQSVENNPVYEGATSSPTNVEQMDIHENNHETAGIALLDTMSEEINGTLPEPTQIEIEKIEDISNTENATLGVDSMDLKMNAGANIRNESSTETTTVAEVPVSTSDCMIVVGAFKNQSNARKMEKELIRIGYQPYLVERVGLWHVGVRKACRTSDLRNALYHTREQITGEAWVLRISGESPN